MSLHIVGTLLNKHGRTTHNLSSKPEFLDSSICFLLVISAPSVAYFQLHYDLSDMLTVVLQQNYL